MLAGMGGVSYHRLVAAVSEAGGFGTMGAAPMQRRADGRRDRQGPRAHRQAVRRRPARRAPRHAARAGAATSSTAAPPCSWPASACPATSSSCATRATCSWRSCAARSATPSPRSRPGCDIVIAQGTEAGGHTGQIATLALVPQVVDAVGDRVPVVAAGGIVDGRGLAAALALGADGIWVGTRFIATPEAHTVHGYKEKLLELHEDGTVVTKAYTGKTCRVVENAYTQRVRRGRRRARAVPDAGREVDAGRRQPPRRRRDQPRASTPTASSGPPARAPAPSTTSSPPASWSSASSRRGRGRPSARRCRRHRSCRFAHRSAAAHSQLLTCSRSVDGVAERA